MHLPDGVAVPAPLVDTTFPPVEATLARLPGFQPADQAAFNPLFLAAYATLRNGGRPIDRRRHPIRLRFRDPDGRQAVQITSSGRPTFTADLMPCTPHHNDHHHHPDRTRS